MKKYANFESEWPWMRFAAHTQAPLSCSLHDFVPALRTRLSEHNRGRTAQDTAGLKKNVLTPDIICCATKGA